VVWIEDGVAIKVADLYETKVTHFSPVNMDLTNGNGACTRINVDLGIMPVPFRIQMTPLTGNFTVDANHQNQVISDALNVVVREPPGIQVRFDMVDSDGNIISAASQTITTGAPSPSGNAWNPPPDPPYADCTSDVYYNEKTILPPNPPPPGFLVFQTPPDYLDPATAEGLAEGNYSPMCGGLTRV
jgi:hypothetical protein